MGVLVVVGLFLGGTLAVAQQKEAPAKQAARVFVGISVEPPAKESDKTGVIIREVTPDSPAAKAGLKPGDRVTKVDSKEVKDFDDLVSALATHKPSEAVSFHVQREGKQETINVTLGELPSGRRRGEQPAQKAMAFLGVHTQPLTPEARNKLGVTSEQGAMVTEVMPTSPAAKAGLQRGDVITSVEGKEIADPLQLRNAITQKHPGEEVMLKVLRGKDQKDIKVRLEELPLDGLSALPVPMPPLGGLGTNALPSALLGAAERIRDLERKVQELEKRLNELERRQQTPPR
jgi:S1-C subfamily serine protease